MTKTLASTLETLNLVGRSDVVLPLSSHLFSPVALTALALRFPGALTLVNNQLVLAGTPEAHVVLRDALQCLYAVEP